MYDCMRDLTVNSFFKATTTTTTTTATKAISKASSSASLAQQDFVLVSENSSNISSNNDEPTGSDLNTFSRQTPNNGDTKQVAKPQQISEEESHLNKLRQLLGAGQKSDAIEVAVKYNMWPHALFLSSTSLSMSTALAPAQMPAQTNDSKALNKVKLKFINSLHPNDPIHTCYQLLIGRVPSVASVSNDIAIVL